MSSQKNSENHADSVKISSMLLDEELKKNKKMGWLLSFIAVAATVAMFAVSWYVSYRSAKKYYKQQATDTMTEVSWQITETIADNIQSRYTQLELVGRLIDTRSTGRDGSGNGGDLIGETDGETAGASGDLIGGTDGETAGTGDELISETGDGLISAAGLGTDGETAGAGSGIGAPPDSEFEGEATAADVTEMLETIGTSPFHNIGVVLEDGTLLLSDGENVDVSEVPAIRKILDGSDTDGVYVPSSEEEGLGEDLILASPYFGEHMSVDGQNVAAVVGTIERDQMIDILDTDVFGEDYAYVVLCDEEGNIILDTNAEKKFKNANVADSLQSFADEETLAQLKTDLADGNRTTLELTGETREFLVYYTPVMDSGVVEENDYDQDSLGNWRLLIMTRADALSRNIMSMFNETRIILSVVLAVLAVLMCACVVLMVTKRNSELRLKCLDSLTNLLRDNRFRRDAALLISGKSECYAMVSYNIVQFKVINSQVGHDTADEMLRIVGREIRKFLRRDETAARSFADRFTVLLRTDTPSGTDRIRELERTLMAARYPDGMNLRFTIGVYLFREQERDVSFAVDRSRFAQSQTREERRVLTNMVVYSEEMFEKQKEEEILEEMAEDAIKERHFLVYYQAKQDIQNGGWAGSEALVRWKDPKLGFIYPSKFIPLFERNGFVVKLDLYVFETVCRDLHEAITKGEPVVPVSVNLSKCHFDDENFLEQYWKIMDSYEVPHHLIEFEVTETMVVTNEPLMREIIRQIHSMGCACSLDDFGTGSSSFHMVQEFEFDTIKLDRSFFYGSHGFTDDSRLIVETMIVLSHKLGKTVISEGIESLEQTEFLREKKCDEIQGYYYAKPVPLSEYKKILAAG